MLARDIWSGHPTFGLFTSQEPFPVCVTSHPFSFVVCDVHTCVTHDTAKCRRTGFL